MVVTAEESLQEFDELASQVSGTKNYHLKFIKEGLLKYTPLINALSKQKRVLRHAMHKPQDLPFKIFFAWLKEDNIYLPLLFGSSVSKNIPFKGLNEILLHTIPNRWAKKAYLQGWDSKKNSYKETCKMFKRMEIEDKVYKGGTPSKTITRADANCASYVRKHKGGEDALTTNPKKGRDGKWKNNHAGYPSDRPIGDKTCLVHGPVQYMEDCKIVK